MADVQPLVRQWMVLRTLSARRYGVGVRELAAELNVTQKTIRRDLQTLDRVGFPLHEEKAARGKKLWKLQNRDGPPQFTFNLTEVLSLYLGRRFLEPLAGTYFWDGAQSAFAKVRASLDEQAIRYLEKIAAAFHETSLGAGDYAKRGQLIDTLMIGVEDRRFTSISYQSTRSTEPVSNIVYPYGLIFHRGSLYLVAFAPEHKEVRHYKVDRIDEAEVLDLRFPKPPDFELQTHLAHTFGVYHGDGQPVRIRVHFLQPVVRYVQESNWHESQQLTPQRDGSLLADFELSRTEEIKSWVLSFGRNAVVLEPDELRAEILSDLKTLIDHYGSKRNRKRRERSADVEDA